MLAWQLFVNPVELSPTSHLWLMLPLFLVVAIIHKTMRITDIRRLWIEVVKLVVYMAAGTAVLAVALWLVMTHFPQS